MLTRLLATSTDGGYWMPQRISTVAPEVDGLFGFVFWLSVFFFVLITVLLLAFVLKYRHRAGDEQPHEPMAGHSTALELTWTIIPTVLVLIIFYFGFRGYLNMAVEPPNPYEVNVTARMWSWTFAYPNGVISDDGKLHIPVNTPVRLVLSSEDVIHSLFLPEFRVKRDAVPGRYNRFWVQAVKTGEFDIYCAEYCGEQHSQMLSKVVVHEMADFKEWLKKASEWEGRLSPIAAGQNFYKTRGCAGCHSVDGGGGTGPTFKDLFGSQVPIQGAGNITVDENYIRESILYPQAKLHAGFGPVMPSYLGQLRDKDITAIIAYMKSISANFKGSLSDLEKVGAPGDAATRPATTQTTKPTTTPAPK